MAKDSNVEHDPPIPPEEVKQKKYEVSNYNPFPVEFMIGIKWYRWEPRQSRVLTSDEVGHADFKMQKKLLSVMEVK